MLRLSTAGSCAHSQLHDRKRKTKSPALARAIAIVIHTTGGTCHANDAICDLIRNADVKTPSTGTTTWISKSGGRLLQEEQNGDIAGKSKAHMSYHWPAKP